MLECEPIGMHRACGHTWCACLVLPLQRVEMQRREPTVDRILLVAAGCSCSGDGQLRPLMAAEGAFTHSGKSQEAGA